MGYRHSHTLRAHHTRSFPQATPPHLTEEKIWDLTQQINVKGVWWGCKYAIVAMRNNPEDPSKGLRKGGSIINTASFVGSMGAATPQIAYTASKGAVLAMTREMAMVHAREGIRVNALSP